MSVTISHVLDKNENIILEKNYVYLIIICVYNEQSDGSVNSWLVVIICC